MHASSRETREEVQHYQQEGVMTMEMEAEALCAAAQYWGVELMAAFVVSDSLAAGIWKPAFRSEAVQVGLLGLSHAARATLA